MKKRKKKLCKSWNVFAAAISLWVLSYFLDDAVYSFFRGFTSKIFDFFFLFITNLTFVLIFFIAVPSLFFYKNRKDLFSLWTAVILSFIISFILKIVVSRQRPEEAIVGNFLGLNDYSFPSTHSMLVFSVLPIMIQKTRHGKIYLLMAALVAFSRVYLNVHYLSDIVFGAILGYCIGFLILKKHNSTTA